MGTRRPVPARSLLFGAIAALLLAAGADHAAAQDKGFSFAVYGDSRPMMYLPLKEGQPDVSKLFVEMFGLVAAMFPERWTQRLSLGWSWVVPAAAMLACVYLTLPWFRLS